MVFKLAEIFSNVARREDLELNRIAKEGIFFMPELAFAYACGKEAMIHSKEIFGQTDVRWQREENLGAGGPSDLIFKLSDEKQIIVEFKMRDKINSYNSDIKKLSRMGSLDAKIFCVLLDMFTKYLPDDGRLKQLEESSGECLIPLQNPFLSFSTIQHSYTNPISCVVGVWSVGEPPEWCLSST